MSVLWLVPLALLGLVALIVALLAVPYFFSVEARVDRGVSGAVEVRPGFARAPRLFRMDLPPAKDTRKKDLPDKAAEKPAKPKRGRRRHRVSVRGIQPRTVAAAGLALFSDLGKAVRFESLRIDADVGLADPADTGQAFGMILPLVHMPWGRRVALDIRPRFDGARFEGEAAGVIRIVPLLVLLPVLVFAWRVWVRRA